MVFIEASQFCKFWAFSCRISILNSSAPLGFKNVQNFVRIHQILLDFMEFCQNLSTSSSRVLKSASRKKTPAAVDPKARYRVPTSFSVLQELHTVLLVKWSFIKTHQNQQVESSVIISILHGNQAGTTSMDVQLHRNLKWKFSYASCNIEILIFIEPILNQCSNSQPYTRSFF